MNSGVRLSASERGRGSLISMLSCSRPGPPREHQHAVGQKHRLVDLVGDEQHGLAALLPDAQQLGLHDLARLRVERGERLVHQQHVGIDRERAGEIDALAHAAGKLARIIVLEAAEADELEQVERALALLVADLARRPRGRSARWPAPCARAAGCRSGTRSRGCCPARAAAGRRAGWCRSVAGSSPATMRRNVVLPQPLGPTTEMNSPCSTATSMLAQRFQLAEPLAQTGDFDLARHGLSPWSRARAAFRASRSPPSWRCRRPPARSRRRTAPAC